MHLEETMAHSHEFSLVVLSIVVALVGSYVALDFSEQAIVSKGEMAHFRWLFGGGLVLGMTVWAMHFTAMLAFNTDVPITWDFAIVFVSMMVAVAGSTAGLIFVGQRRPLARGVLLGGGVFVGFAIVGMHFAGIAAMRLEALPVYDAWWVLLSAAVAMVGSGAALWLMFCGRSGEMAPPVLVEVARKTGSAALMAFAIVGMHFAAMHALDLIPIQGAGDPSEQPVSPAFSNSFLAWAVGGATLLVLALALVSSSYGRRARVRAAGEEAGRRAREEGERRFRSLVQNSSEVVKITDIDGTLRYASPAFGRVFGYDPEKAVGTNVLDYVHPEDLARVKEETEKALAEPGVGRNTVEYRFRHADGSWRHVESVGTYLLDDPAVGGVVVNVRDVTERKEFEERLAHQAFHDPLTGLPNRALLLDRLKHALLRARGRREDGGVGVLFLDLDDFKHVNDSLGHEAGDGLLVAVAARLGRTLRPEDTVARLGGDEFCVLLENPEGSGIEGAVEVARRVSEELGRAPFAVGETGREEVSITASIGIALSDGSHHRPADLLKEADIAMYRAKETGKGRYEVFESRLAEKATERMRMKHDLQRALEREEFELYYQPKVCLKTGEILYMEGLIRWNHPERGILLPGEFIPTAEETGLIIPMGRWAVGEALRQGRRWRDQKKDALVSRGRPSSPGVCVNLSARQLTQEGLVADISRMLRETGTEPEAFGLEMTESVLMEDEHSLAVLAEIRAMGVTLSIDDFGTGYASLSYLKRIPANVLKIDCSFVEGIEDNPRDAVMISGIINLARATGKQVVAECVENAGQLALLKETGCEMGQGYYFSEALPVEAAAQFVESYSPEALLPARPGDSRLR